MRTFLLVRHAILVSFGFVPLASLAAPLPSPAKTETAPRRAANILAVLPLASQDPNNPSARALTEALADEILRLKQVRVMERSQVDLLLKEQGFQQSGACDGSECAVQMGRLLGLDLLVVGSLGKIGNTHTLAVRAVDVGTGEILTSSRRSVRGDIDLLLTEMIPSIARELVAGITRTVGTAPTIRTETFTDPRDDQHYEYVPIGDLFWMTRNMNYRVSEYASWCYDNAQDDCNFLGRLYTWDKATLACPTGWRLPSNQDWDDLAESLGGKAKAGAHMRSPKGGRDSSLFRARAGGFRDPDGGYFGTGTFAMWWTSSESESTSADFRSLDFSNLIFGADQANKTMGYSVRCVRPYR